MKFGNYIASVEYDAEIDMFFGRVVNLSSPITFYGRSVDELKTAFEQSLATYLEVCRERGLEPEKPHPAAELAVPSR
ncbi:MAG: type II toxin-antitoxin system HicB family antitoxin [Chloroflexi bacterium]|nr:type II toxin-antitoxin system HicB family antitoxin [Chloroflexota bacterium]